MFLLPSSPHGAYRPYCATHFSVFYSPPQVSMDSLWTPHSPRGVLMESLWSLCGLHGLHEDSTPNPQILWRVHEFWVDYDKFW